jgi:[ribosomal protein S18]-alanine N-acetyltransferase
MAPDLEYSISRLRRDDPLEDVVRLEAASFSSPWSREMLARELRNEDVARVYVLRNPRLELLAFCACWFIADELHINTLAVRADVRRRGLATRLMRHVFEEAVAAGARQATLEVRRSNVAALRLYEGLGFQIQAIRPDYYSHPIEDGLILWRRELDVLRSNPQP